MRRAMALLRAEGVGLRRRGSVLLERVDLSVEPGELLTLIGPNGGGKTTLVRVLLGLVAPTSGRVVRHRLLRVGYTPQGVLRSRVPLTVGRFLRTALERGSLAAGALGAVLDEVGASALVDRPLDDLSGGEFQRVLLARALLRRPNLLVLDEPMSGVDHVGQLMLYGLIDSIRREHGLGVILVSHDLHLVMASSEQVVCLNRHVCCRGTPESLVGEASFQEIFGEGFARQLAFYQHERGHDHSHRRLVAPL